MKKIKLYKVICSVCAALIFLGAVIPLSANAEESPMTISYENKEQIEQAIIDYVDEFKEVTPSVSIIVFNNEQDICSVIYGESNVEEHNKADENTVYEWGSVSKLLVWTSVMQLYEQGKLDLNEDIRTYLPEGFLKNLSYDDSITMLDLMNHSAGFQETIWELETHDQDKLMPLDKALQKTAPVQTSCPGETVSYSNWSAALAGFIVECVSGIDFVEYVNENIFSPLGMEHTYLSPDASDNEWAAEQRKKTHCYVYFGDEVQQLGECRTYIHLYPAGSAGGTISDLALFAKAFLCDSKDCPLFQNDDTLDLMLSPSRYFADETTPRLCHGMFFSDYGSGLYGHGGNTEGFSAELELDLENKTGFVMMTNKQRDSVYSTGLCELLYGNYHTTTSSNFQTIDLSGHYKMGRSVGGAGALRILSPYEDMLNIWEQDGSFTGNLGVIEYQQVSDYFVEMELINGLKKNVIIKKDENGNVAAIETFQAIDYVKESAAKYYTDLVIIVLLIVPIVIMTVLFIIHIIRLKKYKEQPIYQFKRQEMLSSLAVAAITVEAVILLITFGNSFTAGRVYYAAACITLSVLAVLAVVFIVRCWFVKEKPKNKILLVCETICNVLIIVGIIYWRLFQFWGF